ncbi:SRPBCC family protein [Qipengyuania vesicularis]|uniref:SRPBCC family protein n=1 Tax=Qipengyuania vesicularis TaxID=2867232 RepID=UPI001C88D09C|nr:SRPBCC family protein [Qipengyuania vesicularis]MBX7526594.1 SRPBCC family protein [Qipengyuania vesicularis]
MRNSIVLAAALAMGASMPLSAEVVEQGEAAFVTRDSATVAATPRQAWLALIKPGEWWNDSHTWSGDASNMTLVPSAGGCFCEKIPGSGDIPLDGSVEHMVVIQASPDRALRMRGALGPLQAVPAIGILTITLEEVEGGTKIGWEYNVGGVSGFPIETIAAAVDGVMTQQLHGLRDQLGPLETDEDSEADEGEDEVGKEDESED